MLRRLIAPVFGAFVTIALLAGCSGLSVLNSIASSDGYTQSKDVVFDTQDSLALDVYKPNNAVNAPVVVFFYGDRWQAGDKQDYLFMGQALTKMGYVTVIPNYRLYPQARFPAFVQDCARAVRWVHDNASHYGGDPNKIVIMGHDAGAYNAAMLALDPEFLKAAGMSRNDLKGMIGLAGPYNFLPITDPTLRVIFSPPEKFGQTQPVFWVDGGNPPMLLISGRNDKVIPVSNTRDLAQRIKDGGGVVNTVLYDDLSHGMIVAAFGDSVLFGSADVPRYVDKFVREVCGLPPPANPQ